jgi:hypothetical protein
MITPEEEAYILTKAQVPEHIVSLMTLISKGDPFLMEDCLGLVNDNWLILVGYPLEGIFSREGCERVLNRAVETYRPEVLWFIGPEIPASLMDSCNEKQSDRYYVLDIARFTVKPFLRRAVEKASGELTMERARVVTSEHEGLITELLGRGELPDRVRELYRALPDYIGRSSSAWMLNARDRAGRLTAFMVVELGAKDFSAYILGSHSKQHYVPYASDLLFLEMINLTREYGKNTIHLGLGVNEGIRRFKEKWGGKPVLGYEFCERRYGPAKKPSLIDALMGKFNYTKNDVRGR